MASRRPVALLVLAGLLAGCTTPSAESGDAAAQASAPERLVEVTDEISFAMGSGYQACVVIICFVSGNADHYELPQANHTAVDITMDLAPDVQSQTLGPHRPVRFTLACRPDNRYGCQGWSDVVVEGATFPMQLVATNLTLRADDRLVVDVEYIGQDAGATKGAGVYYEGYGTLTSRQRGDA